jgi:hypothetical protein
MAHEFFLREGDLGWQTKGKVKASHKNTYGTEVSCPHHHSNVRPQNERNFH